MFIDDTKRQHILRGLFDDLYAECTAEVIFDTNRAWCGWMPAIAQLFPDAKVIAWVRELHPRQAIAGYDLEPCQDRRPRPRRSA